MSDDRYFRTSSFYTAVFLFTNGMDISGIDKLSNPKRATFVFANHPDMEDLLQAFNYGKENDPSVMVDARKMITATRQLKEKLYQDTF